MAAASAPASALEEARGVLDPAEEVVRAEWAPPARLARDQLPLSLFGLLWLGGRAGARIATDMRAIGLVAVLAAASVVLGVGALLARGRAWLAARSTVCAITDRRRLISEGFPWHRVRSGGPADINLAGRIQRADGTADLFFRHEREITRQERGRGMWRMRRLGFLGIPVGGPTGQGGGPRAA